MGVIFRDESNNLSSTMIGYSDATVTTPNHPLLMLQYHNYEGYFVIRLYFIPLINGQRGKKFL